MNPLNRIDGVGAVSLMGAPVREIQVNVDPKRLEAYNLSVEQLGQIIGAENLDTPGGTIDVGQLTLSIRAIGELKSSDQLRDIVISDRGGRPVYLRDVAEIRDTLEKATLVERINGRQGVRIIVQKQSGSNSVQIANAVQDMLPELQATLPSDIHLGVVFSTAALLKSAYSRMKKLLFAQGLPVAAEEFHCPGQYKALRKGRPNAEDLANAKAFAASVLDLVSQ